MTKIIFQSEFCRHHARAGDEGTPCATVVFEVPAGKLVVEVSDDPSADRVWIRLESEKAALLSSQMTHQTVVLGIEETET